MTVATPIPPNQLYTVQSGNSLTVTQETIDLGSAAGTGIQLDGDFSITNSTLTANIIQMGQSDAYTSGYHRQMIARDSTISLYGGLFEYAGSVILNSSTLAGNVFLGSEPAVNHPNVFELDTRSTVIGTVSLAWAFFLEVVGSSSIQSSTGSAVLMSGTTTLVLSGGAAIVGQSAAIEVSGNNALADSALTSIDLEADSKVSGISGPAIELTKAPSSQAVQVTINNSTISGGNGIAVHGASDFMGTLSLESSGSVIIGDIRMDSGTTTDVSLSNASKMTGAMVGVSALALSGNSIWTLTSDSEVGAISATTGTINAAASGLSLGSIDGNGTLAADLSKVNVSPAVHVSGDMSGTWQVGITDTQHNFPPGSLRQSYVVAQVGGENKAAVSGESDIGAYEYTSTIDQNKEIVAVLTRFPAAPLVPGTPIAPDEPGSQPVLNDGATASVDAMSVAATKAMWDTQFSALHLRAQNLRDFAPAQYSLWAQGYGGEYKLSNGYSTTDQDRFDDTVSGMSVGADMTLHRDDVSQLYGGLYLSFVGENRSANGSSGTSHGNAFGAYATWQHISGWYIEGMLAYGTLQNGFTANYYGDPSRTVVNANQWDARSTALYVELGKQFELPGAWMIQPAIGTRFLHANGQSFTTDVGNNVSADPVNSSGVNASLTLSKVFFHNDLQYRPYLRFGYADEFAGTQTVHYGGASIDAKLDTTRGFLNCGVEALIAKRHSLFLDFQYQDGHNMQNTYLVNGGYRYTF